MAFPVAGSYNAAMDARGTYHHHPLDCGVEFAALPLSGRRTTCYQIRILAGLADEPDAMPGLARVVEEMLGKGTESRSAQELSDAFDAIGAQSGSSVGRESIVFRCGCLPEYVEDALALHAEMLRTPTLPEEYLRVAIDLGIQELKGLEDDPGELSQKLIAPHAFGKRLGRHELGTEEGLRRIRREDILNFWRRHFTAGRMQIAFGGVVDVGKVEQGVERLFTGFNGCTQSGRDGHRLTFTPGVWHHEKELEQEHVLLCWPGLRLTDEDYHVERVVLTILSGGMSSRLFTEVREKQGLVYWVGAWGEHPRRGGLIMLGASTTPARCDQTVRTLLREVDRLAEDVTEEELDRAKVGLIAKTQTHGDVTRARLGELSTDLFHHGRPIPTEEKNERVASVTIGDIRRYLSEHPRDERCVQTLGPRALDGVGL